MFGWFFGLWVDVWFLFFWFFSGVLGVFFVYSCGGGFGIGFFIWIGLYCIFVLFLCVLCVWGILYFCICVDEFGIVK